MRYALFIFISLCLISGVVTYQGVRHDNTLTGSGITGDELKVDTTKVATRTYVSGFSTSAPSIRTISPSQITSDQDNYSPTGVGNATYLRLDGDNGIRAITGITDSTAGILYKTLLNVGSYPIYLPMEHPDSDAAHRFTGYPGDFILAPGQAVNILYDVTSSRWRVIGTINYTLMDGQYYEWYASSVTSGDYGQVTIVNVSGSHTAKASTTSLPAYTAASTTTSSTGFAWLYYAKSVVTYTAFASAHNFAEALVSIPTLSDGTETYTATLQISNGVNSGVLEANNTVGIRYSHGINSGKWQLFTQDNAGAESVADLGVTVATATLYKLRIEIDKSKTEVRAYINDAYAGRVTGNMPNSVVCGSKVMIAKSAGTTARVLNIHNFKAGAVYP